MSRWVELYATSPSGKTLFICRMCGRKSPTPDRTCASPPEAYQRAPLECALLEEMEEALSDEQAHSPARREGKIVMVSEKGEPGPDGKVRYAIVWRSLESQWNTTEIYMKNESVKK